MSLFENDKWLQCLNWLNTEGRKIVDSFGIDTNVDYNWDEEEDRIVYKVYNIGEQYPSFVLATKKEHSVIVELTRTTERLEGKRFFHIYHSRIGTPESIDNQIQVTFGEPEIYSMFEV